MGRSLCSSWAVSCLVAAAISLVAGSASAAIWYVDIDNVSNPQNGTCWLNAFQSIQDAVSGATEGGGGEVWVAEGVYMGGGLTVLAMAQHVHIYGGFSGVETAREQRDWLNHVTVISGSDIRYCVVGADDATLDGFTVTHGYGQWGAGMNNNTSSPTVANCIFQENVAVESGGGMYNGSSTAMISNCTFADNSCGSYGGGMYNYSASVTLTDCVFSDNEATSGGGIANYSSSPMITGCTFTGNVAILEYGGGGGLMNRDSSFPTVSDCVFSENAGDNGAGMLNLNSSTASVTNCVFVGNAALWGGAMGNAGESSAAPVMNCTIAHNDGGGIYSYSACSVTLTNCILWGNTLTPGDPQIGGSATVTYSCLEGGWEGTGNITDDPLFEVPETDLRLQSDSPCVDTGTSDGAPSTDIEGTLRPQGEGFDMGAYERPAAGALELTCPNGGEQWGCGTTQTITWVNGSLDAGATVRLGLEKGGVFVDWIVRQTDNDGAYSWIVWTDLVPADDYAIRVQSYTENTYRDSSDAPFSILPLTVEEPNGGETWMMGDVHVIEWVSNPAAVGADVRVGLHFGTEFLYWINRQTANDGQYFWKAPADLTPGYGYRIRVQAYGDTTIRDLSDAPFSLELPALLWTSPDFHDELTAGQTYTVTWECNDIGLVGSAVRIGLHRGGAFIDWMIRKTDNDGAWNWTVPTGLTAAPSYRLRLQSYTDSTVRTMSPAFTIVLP